MKPKKRFSDNPKSRILVNFDKRLGTGAIERWLCEHNLEWYCVQDFMRRYEIEVSSGHEHEVQVKLEASGLIEKVVSVIKPNVSKFRDGKKNGGKGKSR